MASEKHGLKPDYYVKTFHPDNYWSATPADKREEWCWYNGSSNDHDRYHDNIFDLHPDRTMAFMKTVSRPWVAFKVMAAGAIPAQVGINHAFQHGADFVIAGMFDFQLAADVEIVVKAPQAYQARANGPGGREIFSDGSTVTRLPTGNRTHGSPLTVS